MNRDQALSQLQDTPTQPWDVLVVGGGATGLGCAVDAASRGFKTLLIEQADFAQATSSRSTKLIHGGFRYLKQGNISLVRESLRERGLLLQNAPHLVHPLAFILPCQNRLDQLYYGLGLKLYDALAGRLGLHPSKFLSRDQTLRELPALQPGRVGAGLRYFDAQFDDARLVVHLALTLEQLGGVAVNYFQAAAFTRQGDKLTGLVGRDLERNREHTVRARVVINATGIFTDTLRHMDDPQTPPVMTSSQGAHVVLDESFLPGQTALMIPKTDDGRILFAIPWLGRVLVGTTDTPVDSPALDPRPLDPEIGFLLEHIGRYLTRAPSRSDVRSAFAGLRPLVSQQPGRKTSRIARDHTLLTAPSGLVTITGGKWTTYRAMAEQTVDRALQVAGLDPVPSNTASLRLHGATDSQKEDAHRAGWPKVEDRLHPNLPYAEMDIVRAARDEMARSLEDALSRRTRALILDARASLEIAPECARILAGVLGRDNAWIESEIARFGPVARAHLA